MYRYLVTRSSFNCNLNIWFSYSTHAVSSTVDRYRYISYYLKLTTYTWITIILIQVVHVVLSSADQLYKTALWQCCDIGVILQMILTHVSTGMCASNLCLFSSSKLEVWTYAVDNHDPINIFSNASHLLHSVPAF